MLTSRKLLILALILAIGAGRHILDNGIDYVSHPRLNALDEVLNYSGKGFECVAILSSLVGSADAAGTLDLEEKVDRSRLFLWKRRRNGRRRS